MLEDTAEETNVGDKLIREREANDVLQVFAWVLEVLNRQCM